jgi:hypothetical protein
MVPVPIRGQQAGDGKLMLNGAHCMRHAARHHRRDMHIPTLTINVKTPCAGQAGLRRSAVSFGRTVETIMSAVAPHAAPEHEKGGRA